MENNVRCISKWLVNFYLLSQYHMDTFESPYHFMFMVLSPSSTTLSVVNQVQLIFFIIFVLLFMRGMIIKAGMNVDMAYIFYEIKYFNFPTKGND